MKIHFTHQIHRGRPLSRNVHSIGGLLAQRGCMREQIGVFIRARRRRLACMLILL